MSRVLTSPAPARPAALTRDPVQMPVVVAATALLALGTAWLAARYGARQAVLFLVGGALGLVLHHAAFGFTAAYRALVTVGDGRGVRAQLLMLATATVLFAPVLASGEIFGRPVAGAVAPAGVSWARSSSPSECSSPADAGPGCSTTWARVSRRWP